MLLVRNVHHGGRVFLRLQELLELRQLGLLLLVGNVEPLLNVELVALVLCSIGQGGVVEADDLVNSPTMRMIIQLDGSVKLLPGLFLADLQFLAGGFRHLFCEPFHHLQQLIILHPARIRNVNSYLSLGKTGQLETVLGVDEISEPDKVVRGILHGDVNDCRVTAVVPDEINKN